ncbi:Hypothetical protein CINCED_3A007980 [Cinara cedri]|uniref:Uncharacterized protein n=1 Tax=Cinara cedri TaxID=506608 RepID=A0A5E4MNY9_9HEMI|nr:Hypothetical protein CINCED_3A007980 [Cinara cedri]
MIFTNTLSMSMFTSSVRQRCVYAQTSAVTDRQARGEYFGLSTVSYSQLLQPFCCFSHLEWTTLRSKYWVFGSDLPFALHQQTPRFFYFSSSVACLSKHSKILMNMDKVSPYSYPKKMDYMKKDTLCIWKDKKENNKTHLIEKYLIGLANSAVEKFTEVTINNLTDWLKLLMFLFHSSNDDQLEYGVEEIIDKREKYGGN